MTARVEQAVYDVRKREASGRVGIPQVDNRSVVVLLALVVQLAKAGDILADLVYERIGREQEGFERQRSC
jgi:hypothetical protein